METIFIKTRGSIAAASAEPNRLDRPASPKSWTLVDNMTGVDGFTGFFTLSSLSCDLIRTPGSATRLKVSDAGPAARREASRKSGRRADMARNSPTSTLGLREVANADPADPTVAGAEGILAVRPARRPMAAPRALPSLMAAHCWIGLTNCGAISSLALFRSPGRLEAIVARRAEIRTIRDWIKSSRKSNRVEIEIAKYTVDYYQIGSNANALRLSRQVALKLRRYFQNRGKRSLRKTNAINIVRPNKTIIAFRERKR